MHKKIQLKYVLLLLLFLGSYIFINSFSKTLLVIPSSTGKSGFIYTQDILGFKIVDFMTKKTYRRYYYPFFMDYQKFYLLGINGYPNYLEYYEEYSKYKNMDYVFFERHYRSMNDRSPHLGPIYFKNLNKIVNLYRSQYESSSKGRNIYTIAIYDSNKNNDRLKHIDIFKDENCIYRPRVYYTDEREQSLIFFLCDKIPHVYDLKKEEFIEITNEIAVMDFKEYNLSYFPDMTNNNSDTKSFNHGDVNIRQEIDFHGTGPFGGIAWHKSNIQVEVGGNNIFKRNYKNDALYQYFYDSDNRRLHLITMMGKSFSVLIPKNAVFKDIDNRDRLTIDPPNLKLLAFLCGKSNGRWEQDNCNMPTSDGGISCSDNSECENGCIAELSNEEWKSIDEDGMAVTKIGTCSRWKNKLRYQRTPYVINGQVNEQTITVN